MKKVLTGMTLFFVLVTATNVFAMDDPITVRTEPGNHVRLYTWMPDGGPLLNLKEGDADEDGIFRTTFFSLHEPTVKYQVRILKGLTPITEATFEGKGIENPLLIDCTTGTCVISVDTSIIVEEELIEETVEEEVTEETTEEETPEETDEEVSEEELGESQVEENSEEGANETVETIESGDTRDLSGFSFTGNAIFTKDDGSLKVGFLSAIGFIFIIAMGLLMGLSRHQSHPERKGLRYKEKELRKIEKEIKNKETAIKNVKEENLRKRKIEEAKHKLEEEEKELNALEEDSSGLSEAKVKLSEKEEELKRLKEEE